MLLIKILIMLMSQMNVVILLHRKSHWVNQYDTKTSINCNEVPAGISKQMRANQ